MKGKKILFDRDVLVKLYNEKRLNAYQIAKRFDCGSTTIYRKLEEYGIERRDISECHLRYQKSPFSNDPKEKAYLIGLRLGDLHVRRAINSRGCKTIRVEAHTTKRVQIELIASTFKEYTHVHSKDIVKGNGRQNTIRALCFLDDSFSFLLPKDDFVEDWIKRDRLFFLSFLAGYVDAEGHLGIHKNNGAGHLLIRTQDKGIILDIDKGLTRFGFSHPESRCVIKAGYAPPSDPKKPQNKDVWEVAVYMPTLYHLLSELTPLLRHEKRKSDGLRVLNHVTLQYESRKNKMD